MVARLSHTTKISLALGACLVLLALTSSRASAAQTATLSLTPATVSTSVGQTFTVSIQLNTGGTPSDGARIIMLYDKNLLTATKITPGTMFKEYPTNAQSIDTTTGTVKISGIADTNQTFTGAGTFASVEFTAKAPGSAQIGFDFTQGSTTDSNVASTDQATGTAVDILQQATGATVTIAQGVSATTQPGTSLPDTATLSPTVMLSSIGGALIFLGLALFFAF